MLVSQQLTEIIHAPLRQSLCQTLGSFIVLLVLDPTLGLCRNALASARDADKVRHVFMWTSQVQGKSAGCLWLQHWLGILRKRSKQPLLLQMATWQPQPLLTQTSQPHLMTLMRQPHLVSLTPQPQLIALMLQSHFMIPTWQLAPPDTDAAAPPHDTDVAAPLPPPPLCRDGKVFMAAINLIKRVPDEGKKTTRWLPPS